MAYYDPPDPANPTLAEFPAKGTRRNDIGAYGGPGSRILANTVVGIYDPEGVIPGKFELNQNYPNPFNPSTLISYRLPSTSDVKLSVCDLIGREVAVLVNESQAPGSYRVEWNAMNFGSGVYFYRLQAGNFSEARQMLLLK